MGRRKKLPTSKVSVRNVAGRPLEFQYFCPIQRKTIRRSSGTYNQNEAAEAAKLLEAKLLTGTYQGEGDIYWQRFRDAYEDRELSQLGSRSEEHAITALNAAEAILKPQFLSDVAHPDALATLRNRLMDGTESRYGRARSPHTVKSYLTALITALKWAAKPGRKWIPYAPEMPRMRVGKVKTMKGRPLTDAEFKKMLKQLPKRVGKVAAPSWDYTLRGIWESTLRIEEAMNVSWDIPGTIRPRWPKGGLPVLDIPSAMQKNTDEQELPLLPGFEKLLLETPKAKRCGWVFNPMSLETMMGRRVRIERPSVAWVGKIISDLGEGAGIVVDAGDAKTKRPPKYASAHDLRRSCADRLEAAGVDPLLIARIMRHQSFETTMKHYRKAHVQRDAAKVREALVPKNKRSQSGHNRRKK